MALRKLDDFREELDAMRSSARSELRAALDAQRAASLEAAQQDAERASQRMAAALDASLAAMHAAMCKHIEDCHLSLRGGGGEDNGDANNVAQLAAGASAGGGSSSSSSKGTRPTAGDLTRAVRRLTRAADPGPLALKRDWQPAELQQAAAAVDAGSQLVGSAVTCASTASTASVQDGSGVAGAEALAADEVRGDACVGIFGP